MNMQAMNGDGIANAKMVNGLIVILVVILAVFLKADTITLDLKDLDPQLWSIIDMRYVTSKNKVLPQFFISTKFNKK